MQANRSRSKPPDRHDSVQREANERDYRSYMEQRSHEMENSHRLSLLDRQMGALEADRTQLMSRIQGLTHQNNQFAQERTLLLQQLRDERARNEELQRRLQHASQVQSVVDRNAMTDLKYEKEESNRLKGLLHSVEVDRVELRSKLRDFEESNTAILHEKQDLTAKLQQHIDQVHILDSDNKVIGDRLNTVTAKLSQRENEMQGLRHDNHVLQENVARLEAHIDELNARLRDEFARHESYQVSKNNEFANLKWMHERHLRIMATRSIGSDLSKLSLRRVNSAWRSLKHFLFIGMMQGKKAKNLALYTQKWLHYRTSQAFAQWKSSLNWMQTNANRNSLVDKFSENSVLSKYFADWRGAFHDLLRKRQRKIYAISILFKHFENDKQHKQRLRFLQWKNTYNFIISRNNTVQSLQIKAAVGKLRSAMDKWNRFTEKSRELQAREDLASELSGFILSLQYFKAFKEYVNQQKLERKLDHHKASSADKLMQINVLNRLKRYTTNKRRKEHAVRRMVYHWIHRDESRVFNKWRENLERSKKIEHFNRVMLSKNRALTNLTHEKLFYVWKQWHFAGKLKSTSGELNNERPLRMSLENTLNQMNEMNLTNAQMRACRAISKQLHGHLSSYFEHWQGRSQYYRLSLPRVFRVIRKKYMGSLSLTFHFWKKQSKDMDVYELCRKIESTLGHNDALNHRISDLEENIEMREAYRKDNAARVLRKTVAHLTNKDTLTALRQWARRALVQANYERGSLYLDKKIVLKLYKECFRRIHTQSIFNRKLSNRKDRLTYQVMLKLRKTQATFFDLWKLYREDRREFRRRLIKADKRKVFNYFQQALNIWKQSIKTSIEIEIKNKAYEVSANERSLQQSLLERTSEFEEAARLLERSQKKLSKNCRLRLKNCLQLCLNKAKSHFFYKWNGLIHTHKLGTIQMLRLVRVLNKKWMRFSWRNWTTFVKTNIDSNAKTEIKRLHDEYKKMNREHKGTISELQNGISEHENTIKIYQSDLDKTKRRHKFLVMRGVHQMQTEYSDNRASFAFLAWKDRYQHVKLMLQRMSVKVGLIRRRKAFKLISLAANDNAKLAELRNLLMTTCRKYSFRFMRNLFDRWNRNAHAVWQNSLETTLRKEQMNSSQLRQHQRLIKSKNRDKFFGILVRKQKGLLMKTWKNTTRKIKAVRQASAEFNNRDRLSKLSLGMNNLLAFKNDKKSMFKKSCKSFLHAEKGLVKRVFFSWKDLHLGYAYLKQTFSRIWKRHYRDAMHNSMSELKKISTFNQSHSQWQFRSRKSKISHILLLISKKMIVRAMRKWTDLCSFKIKGENVLRGTMLRALTRKMRQAWVLWEECYVVSNVERHVNKYGPAAIENFALKNRVRILDQLIKDEGIDSRYVENYILEKENLVGALRVKKLNRTSGQLNTLLPRMFMIWKLWTLKRKKIKKVCFRMQVYRKKGPMLHAFSTWKHGFPLVVNTVNKYTRRELYSVIAKLDRDVKTLEGRLEVHSKDLVYMQTYARILEQQTRKGQNQSLLLCSRNVQSTLHKGLLRWAVHSQLLKVHELLANLTQLEEDYLNLKAYSRSIEEENKSVIEENMELRQASLDGIAIADAFETLTKEREKLSVDLADRAATIKRLLEENSHLSYKLSMMATELSFPEKEFPRPYQ